MKMAKKSENGEKSENCENQKMVKKYENAEKI